MPAARAMHALSHQAPPASAVRAEQARTDSARGRPVRRLCLRPQMISRLRYHPPRQMTTTAQELLRCLHVHLLGCISWARRDAVHQDVGALGAQRRRERDRVRHRARGAGRACRGVLRRLPGYRRQFALLPHTLTLELVCSWPPLPAHACSPTSIDAPNSTLKHVRSTPSLPARAQAPDL